jgi:lipopolysaccharide biosynthesis glycosyltransferase
MTTPDRALHIALAFDENFGPPAYATARGICLSTRRRADLVFHLCHPGLSGETMALLEMIATEFGAALVHHNVADDPDFRHFASSLPHTRYISEVMYARLLLGRIVDPSIKRIVYIDCDILVRAPIEGLVEQDLAGRPLGAIRDPQTPLPGNSRDIRQLREIHDPADPFFNSGVLVIDLDQWRRMDVIATLLALQEKGTLERLNNDQHILNYLFKNSWAQIDPAWNTFAVGKVVELLDPKAVHYTGLSKPWNLISFVPFHRLYRHVMTNEVFYRYMRQRWARSLKARLGIKPSRQASLPRPTS